MRRVVGCETHTDVRHKFQSNSVCSFKKSVRYIVVCEAMKKLVEIEVTIKIFKLLVLSLQMVRLTLLDMQEIYRYTVFYLYK